MVCNHILAMLGLVVLRLLLMQAVWSTLFPSHFSSSPQRWERDDVCELRIHVWRTCLCSFVCNTNSANATANERHCRQKGAKARDMPERVEMHFSKWKQQTTVLADENSSIDNCERSQKLQFLVEMMAAGAEAIFIIWTVIALRIDMMISIRENQHFLVAAEEKNWFIYCFGAEYSWLQPICIFVRTFCARIIDGMCAASEDIGWAAFERLLRRHAHIHVELTMWQKVFQLLHFIVVCTREYSSIEWQQQTWFQSQPHFLEQVMTNESAFKVVARDLALVMEILVWLRSTQLFKHENSATLLDPILNRQQQDTIYGLESKQIGKHYAFRLFLIWYSLSYRYMFSKI